MESGSGKFDLLRQKQMQLAVMHINLLDEPLHTADQLEYVPCVFYSVV
jgi:hypothetical protein